MFNAKIFNSIIAQNGDQNKNILMMMDIEGSEYEVILNTSEKILEQVWDIQQIVPPLEISHRF